MDLKEKNLFEKYNVDPEQSWWEYSRIKLLKRYFPEIFQKGLGWKILDFGAGAAITSSKIARQNDSNEIIAFDIGYQKEYTDETLPNLSYVKKAKNGDYNFILCLDVLEHIEDDDKALQEIEALMDNKSNLLITVPAHQWLWSYHDEFLEHKRRYSKENFKNLLQKHFDVQIFEYHLSLLFLPAAAFRILFKNSKKQNLRPSAGAVNFTLKRAMDLEYSPFNFLRKFFGLSLVALCRKKIK